jgi:aminopeptidase N
VLAELNNCVRYFSALFGPYPYSRFGAAYHPYPFGQGFPSMLMLPKSSDASKYTYSFIAHETSHQWWGNIMGWRSYRDQWLSEGFADYSGVLYTSLRDKNPKSYQELLHRMHEALLYPPRTETGVGKGRLVDIGPIILGHRLSTSESAGAYSALIYNKGALVLRMLHFLFSDPNTGDDKAFFDMMKEFVRAHENGSASTDDFRYAANQRFANTPIARKYQLQNLNWFFQQWVYESSLPTYELAYWVENLPDGSANLRGTVYQRNVPEKWFMPLPIQVHFGADKYGRGTIYANGPETPVQVHLPRPPESVELDPDHWVLSDKTKTSIRAAVK